jgi:hypothetical protein
MHSALRVIWKRTVRRATGLIFSFTSWS